MTRFSYCLVAMGAALAGPACAGVPVTVVSVHDGDTLTVLVKNQKITIELGDVDAPEASEPFAVRSRQSLVNLCEHRRAVLDEIEVGKLPRVSAYVKCAGLDASNEQVRRGMARVVATDLPRQSPLPKAEADAQAARRGLWGGEAASAEAR